MRTMVKISLMAGVLVFAGPVMGSFTTGFEESDNAGFTLGTKVVGTNPGDTGLDGWYYTDQSDPAAVTADIAGPSYEGDQSMRFDASDTGSNSHTIRVGRRIDPLTGNVQIETAMSYTESGAPTGAFTFAYFGDQPGSDDAATNDAGEVAVQFGFSGSHIVYRDGSSYVDVVSIQEFPEWYNFSADVDLSTKKYDLTITGPNVNTTVTDISFRESSTDRISWMMLLNNETFESNTWADSITVVPEPVTLGLVLVGGLGLIRRKR